LIALKEGLKMSKRNKRSKGKTLAIAAVLAAPALGCTAGWNSLEQALNCNDGTGRTRVINNVAAEVGNAEVSYHGLNEITDADGNTYFGNNRIFLRGKNGKVKVMVRTLANKDGVARTMVGVRTQKLWGTYGFADITSDLDGANLTIFTGKALGKNKTLEFLHSQNWAYAGKPSAHNELQYNHGFHPHWEAIVRAEVPNYDVSKARAMIGVRCKK
jgi:hypothetical protein